MKDLLRAPTIRIRAREDLWPTWTRKFRLAAPAASRRLTVDHTFAALQAAEDALGVVVIPPVMARKHLESGRLFAPFPDMLAESGQYFLLTRPEGMSDAAADVLSWMAGQGSSDDSGRLA